VGVVSGAESTSGREKGGLTMESQVLGQIDPRVLGQRLLEARRAAGFTQQAVADQMDMARTTVVAIEKGERRVTAPELVRFAQAYNRSRRSCRHAT